MITESQLIYLDKDTRLTPREKLILHSTESLMSLWSTTGGAKDFKFSAKFPKVITHEKRLKEVDKELDHFFEAMGRLSNKTLALLIQLPPSLHIHEGLERLRELVPDLDNRFRYAKK